MDNSRIRENLRARNGPLEPWVYDMVAWLLAGEVVDEDGATRLLAAAYAMAEAQRERQRERQAAVLPRRRRWWRRG